jgi:hypothetical protein
MKIYISYELNSVKRSANDGTDLESLASDILITNPLIKNIYIHTDKPAYIFYQQSRNCVCGSHVFKDNYVSEDLVAKVICIKCGRESLIQ